MLPLTRKASPPNMRLSSRPLSDAVNSRMRSARSGSKAMSVEVDAEGQQVAAHGADHRAVERRQLLQPRGRVVVGQQVRRPGPPVTVDPEPHSRIGLDVQHVVGSLAVLGDHPELIADHPAAHSGMPWFAGFAANGLQHGDGQLTADRIDEPALGAMDDASLQITKIHHGATLPSVSRNPWTPARRGTWLRGPDVAGDAVAPARRYPGPGTTPASPARPAGCL